MDSIEFVKNCGFIKSMKINADGLKDVFNSLTGRDSHRMMIIGTPEDFAVLNTPECYEGYMSMATPGSSWKNELPARFVFYTSWYRPISHIAEIMSKGLVVFAELDSLSDADIIEKAFMNKPDIELLKFPCGHFGLFEGEYFKKSVAEELRFLKRVF